MNDPELRVACRAMWREYGYGPCDHCRRLAPYVWTRTAAQIKKIAGRKKNAVGNVFPVSFRCEKHLPVFAPELASQYRDVRVPVSEAEKIIRRINNVAA